MGCRSFKGRGLDTRTLTPICKKSDNIERHLR